MPKEKKLYRIPAKSAKRIQREALEKELHKPDEDSAKEKWFKDRRKEMSGFCQCGCGRRSSKDDDRYFRHSCAHVFPKSKFDSVKLHPLNSVERAFWGGCHSVMDDGSIERWPDMADWKNICEKFKALEPLLTESEKSLKFYTNLKKLVDGTMG